MVDVHDAGVALLVALPASPCPYRREYALAQLRWRLRPVAAPANSPDRPCILAAVNVQGQVVFELPEGIRADYFDEDGERVKTLSTRDLETVEGRELARTMEMEDLITIKA